MESGNKIQKSDIKKVFWRFQLYGGSWNFERMQNVGFLYSIKPLLKRLYANKSKEEMSTAMKRHMEFFNTNPTMAAPIIGVTSALEEAGGNESGDATTAVKVGLMGPLAGLGDSIIWLTWMPICMSLGASYSKEGNPLGLIIAFLMFNIVNMGVKYYGLKIGYNKGAELIKETSESGVLQKYTKMATVLGLVLVGGLIPQMVNLNLALEFTQGELVISLQQIIDQIFPKLLPLLTTLGCYSLIKKGKSSVKILVAIIAISILLVFVGVL